MKVKIALLALIMVSSTILYSCASDNETNTGTTAPDKQETESETIEDRSALDDLGEFDFEGHEFKIYNRIYEGFADYRLDYPEQTGDPYHDEVYLRNRTVEERFNVTISTVEYTDHNAPKNMLLAGDTDFDMYTARLDFAFVIASQGLLYTIDDLPYIDLTKDYWNEFMTDQITIMNKKFFAVGSFNFAVLDIAGVLVFNKQLAENYKIENLFDLVKNGTWTYDKFAEYTKVATMDLDGDGVMGATDAWGFVCRSNDVLPSLWIGGGVTGTEKDENDIPVNMMGSEKFFNVVEKIFEMTWGAGVYYNSNEPNMFIADKVLFNESSPHKLQKLRVMETDFGILPFPKFNEQQPEYYTRMGGCEAFYVSRSMSAESIERTSVILEALACESLKKCVPAYYDLMLKTKIARDVESEEIIDLVFAHRVVDWIDVIWTSELRDGPINTLFTSKNNTLISMNESSYSVIFNKKLDPMIEELSKLED